MQSFARLHSLYDWILRIQVQYDHTTACKVGGLSQTLTVATNWLVFFVWISAMLTAALLPPKPISDFFPNRTASDVAVSWILPNAVH